MDPYTQRLMTGGGNRMMTANRPQSGLRRIPTADGKKGEITGPVGLQANVQIQYRPVTNAGISGMKTQNMGPARQIAGQSWYAIEVNRKSKELMEQITLLQQEAKTIEANNAKYADYEKRHEILFAEVREKEGELADFNLALDQVRSNMNINDIKDSIMTIRKRNESDQHQVNEIFAKVKKTESDCKEIENELEERRARAAQRIQDELGVDAYNEYVELQDENATLNTQIMKKEDDLAAMEAKIASINQQLKSPEHQASKQAFELRKKQAHMKTQLQDLQEETSTNLSPSELRDLYAHKIKEAKKQVADAEARTKELEARTERYQDEIEQKEGELKEAKRIALQERKLEAVYEKAAKMEDFLEKFPSLRKDQLRQNETLKKTITMLLRHIADEMNQDMDQNEYDKIKEATNFKEEKTKVSEETLTRVRQELNERREELDRIVNLDKKIAGELETLTQEQEEMEAQLGKFPTPEQLQIHHQEEKKRLLTLKATTRKKREALKTQVHALSRNFEEEKKMLASSDLNKRLEALEYKMRTRGQLVFELREFIVSRKRESDFEETRKHVLGTVKEINALTVDNMK